MIKLKSRIIFGTLNFLITQGTGHLTQQITLHMTIGFHPVFLLLRGVLMETYLSNRSSPVFPPLGTEKKALMGNV